MTKQFGTTGGGITAQSVTLHSGRDFGVAFRRLTAKWEASMAEGGGTYGAVSFGPVQACREVLAEPDPDAADPEGQCSLAERILELHEAALAEIGRGDADGAARHAFKAGFDAGTLMMKIAWEREALSGLASKESGRKGGRPAGTNLTRDRQMAEEFQREQLRSRLSATALKAAIGSRHGLKKSAAILAIDRALGKSSA